MTTYGTYQDALLNKITDLTNPHTDNVMMKGLTDLNDNASTSHVKLNSSGQIEIHETLLNSKITNGANGFINSGQQVINYASSPSSGNFVPLSVQENGYLETQVKTLDDCVVSNRIQVNNEGGLFSDRHTNHQVYQQGAYPSTAGVDLGANHNYKVIKFWYTFTSAHEIEASNLFLQISQNGSNWMYVGEALSTLMVSVQSTSNEKYVGNVKIEDPPRYVRIFNNTTSTAITIGEIFYVANRH